MFERLRIHKNLLVAFALLGIPALMLVLSEGTKVGTRSSAPARFVRSGIGWIQVGERRLVAGIGDLWGQLTSGQLIEENQRLEKEVARLREEKSRLIGVLQENARLRKLLGFKRRHPNYKLAPAEVVSRDTSPYFRVLTLKLESAANLAPRMPVVVAGGVVGQIHRTYGSLADVIIVSDPRSRIDAISQRNRAQGIVRGLGHERNYRAKIAYLRRRDQVREGDVMVTSGMDGIFPPELIIGRVRAVESGKRGLFQEATLEPAVDFSRIEEVFVITDTE